MNGRTILKFLVLFLLLALPAHAQTPKIDLPQELPAAVDDPEFTRDSAIVVSISSDGIFYVGQTAVARNELGSRVSSLIKQYRSGSNRIYVAASGEVKYESVVTALKVIRDAGVGQIRLAVKPQSAVGPVGTFRI